jgi:hypothetical protein
VPKHVTTSFPVSKQGLAMFASSPCTPTGRCLPNLKASVKKVYGRTRPPRRQGLLFVGPELNVCDENHNMGHEGKAMAQD